MSIRIGANPIGWTNDDLQEIGGDTPLETCLAEARGGRRRRNGEGPQDAERRSSAESQAR